MRADQFLDQAGIQYELVEQDTPTEACDAAAEARGVETGQIVKSLIVRIDGTEHHLLVPGDRHLSEKKVGQYELVEPDRSTELTGCEPGTVHPFASDLPHRVDYRLFQREKLSFTVGSRTEGVIVTSEAFRQALDDAVFDWKEEDLVSFTEQDVEALDDLAVDEETKTFIAKHGYGPVVTSLTDSWPLEDILMAIETLNREDVPVDEAIVETVLERADGETHMQRLVAQYAETGEWAEQKSFDLAAVLDTVLEDNQQAVEDYRSGKESALNFLMGQVMDETQGQADPGTVRQQLQERLDT